MSMRLGVQNLADRTRRNPFAFTDGTMTSLDDASLRV